MRGNKDFKDLPEGWKWVRLGEVIIENPKSPFKVEDCDNFGNFPFFTSGDNILRHSHFLVDEENLFIATGGKAKINYFYDKASYSADTYSLKVKDLNTKYIFYTLLKDVEIIDYKFFSGSGLKHLQKDDFKGSLIPLPPLPEQQKIAEILETVDNAIEKTDKIIEKYKRIKQGLMQDLLTKGIDENGNIRDEKTHKFKDSPIGRIPEEWEVVRLGEIFNIKAGGDIDKLSYCDIKDKRFQYPIFSNTLENKGLYGYSDKFTYPENCITITGRGTLGHAIPRFEKFNAIIRVLVLIPKFEMNIVFVSEYINNKINFIIESTGVPQLTAPKVAEYYIPLPPLPEQQRIAEILSQTDQTIEKEEQYREKLQKIKQGLMEDLLTGKVKVNHLIKEGEGYVSQA